MHWFSEVALDLLLATEHSITAALLSWFSAGFSQDIPGKQPPPVSYKARTVQKGVSAETATGVLLGSWFFV